MAPNDVKLPPEVVSLVETCIDSVPELEALLLLWNARPAALRLREVAQRLYITERETAGILARLQRVGLVMMDEAGYYIDKTSPQLNHIALLSTAYRVQLTAVTRLIHQKPATALREFARAFDVNKNNPK